MLPITVATFTDVTAPARPLNPGAIPAWADKGHSTTDVFSDTGDYASVDYGAFARIFG
jgi:hypothetical protein